MGAGYEIQTITEDNKVHQVIGQDKTAYLS